MHPPPYGSSAGFDVTASLNTESSGSVHGHFQCVLGLRMTLPEAPSRSRTIHADRPLAVATAYKEWLSRDVRLQVIEKIEGFSGSGAGASVRGTAPADWLTAGAQDSRWLFDPGLIDAAAQMVALWTRNYLSEMVVPARYGRVARYRNELPARMRMEFTRTDSPEPECVRGDVVFFDEAGETVFVVEDLDCRLSARAVIPPKGAAEGAVA